MSVELPKDAEGREIPLDTSELFISDGTMVHVLRFEYMYHTHDARDAWFVYIERTPGEHMTLHACDVLLTPPDSWGKLLEDLGRAGSLDDTISPHCRYLNPTGKCSNCMAYPGSSACTYQSRMAFRDIFKRIRKLRGEGDA